MKRGIILAGLLGLATILVAAEPAQAQWFGWRRGAVFGGPYYGGYYYGPYYRSYYYPYYYPPVTVYNPPVTMYNPPATVYNPPATVYSAPVTAYGEPVARQSFYAAQADTGRAVNLHIKVPRADARLWIEGQETQSAGIEREFQSPPLEPGQAYNYTIRAAWMENGDEVSREQKLDVRAGQDVVVDFRKPKVNAAPAPRPLPSGSSRPSPQKVGSAAVSSEDNRVANDKTHEGKVVKAGDGKLAMTDMDGNNKHMHNVAASATVTRDGKDAKLSDLKEGDVIKVTTQTDSTGKNLAVKIEARTRQ
jgi:uncharacterized protein (TIGR03000 family)